MNDFTIFRNISVKMRDGINLATDVYLPDNTGRFPVVLVRTAYNRMAFCRFAVEYLEHGMAFVVQDCRGRYESEGDFYPFVNEADDGHDALCWLHQQKWCNGKVGMFGGSYLAATQFLAVPESASLLSALNPLFMAGDYWKRAYYCDGAFSLALTWSWLCFESVSRASQAGAMSLIDVNKVLRSLPIQNLDEASGGRISESYRDFIKHSQYDDFWEKLNIKKHYDKFTMPVLLVGGWYDNYAAEMLDLFNGLRERASDPKLAQCHRILIGPWSHGMYSTSILGDIDFGENALLEDNITFRWLNAVLHDKASREVQSAPIRIFVMGVNSWRDEYEWPLARTSYEKFYLHENGRLISEMPTRIEGFEQYSYDPADPVSALGGNHSIGAYNPGLYDLVKPGPIDQRPVEQRHDVLVFTSPELACDTEVTGPVKMILYASSSAEDTDFVAKLTDVYPDGRSINLTEGIVRARFRENLWGKPKKIKPGTVYEFCIDMQATSNVFKRGHRIRIDISSSNFPIWDRNLNTGREPGTDTQMLVAEQRIYNNSKYPSHIILPLIREPQTRNA